MTHLCVNQNLSIADTRSTDKNAPTVLFKYSLNISLPGFFARASGTHHNLVGKSTHRRLRFMKARSYKLSFPVRFSSSISSDSLRARKLINDLTIADYADFLNEKGGAAELDK